MDEKIVKLKAASLLLEKGVRYRFTDAPFLLRILRLDRLTIKALRAGTIATFSTVIIEKQLDIRVADKDYLHKNIESICLVIAIAVLNSRLKIRYFSNLLARLLNSKIKYTTLVEIFVTLVEINSAVDFTTITTWAIQQMNMMMSPRMGHEKRVR